MAHPTNERGEALPKRRLVIILLLVVLGFSGSALLYVSELHQLFAQRSRHELADLSQAVSVSVQRQLLDKVESLKVLSIFLAQNDQLDTPEVLEMVRNYNAEHRYLHLVVTTPDRRCFGDDVKVCNALETDDFRFAMSGKPSVDGPYASSYTDMPVLVLSIPVFRQGMLIGTVHSVETIELYEHFLKQFTRGEHVSLQIMRQGGTIIASTDDKLNQNALDLAIQAGTGKYEQIFDIVYHNQPETSVIVSETLNGEHYYTVFSDLFANTSIAASIPASREADMMAGIMRYTVGLFCSLALLLLAMFWYVNRFRRSMVNRLSRVNEELHSVISNMPGGAVQTLDDEEHSLVFMSDGFLALLGFTRDEVASLFDNKLLRMIHEDDVHEIRHAVKDQLARGSTAEVEYRLMCADGSWIWVLQKGRRLFSGGSGSVYSTVVDITEHKMLIEQSLISAESLRLLLDISGNSLFDFDLATGRIVFSQRFTELYGWPDALDNFPQSALDADLVHEEDLPVFLTFVDRLYDGFMLSEAEVRLRDFTGAYRWVAMAAAVVLDKNHAAVKVVGKMEDIDKQKRSLVDLEEKSRRDAFTGLYNKQAAGELIAEALEHTRIGSRGALFIVDVDNFKTLNDTLGHPMGDQALQDLSAELRSIFREDDIVGRLGGDEFIVYMANVRDHAKCYHKADAICQAFRRVYGTGEQRIRLSASVGVALFPDSGLDYSTLYMQADTALYHAKRHGKNQFFVLDGADNEFADARPHNISHETRYETTKRTPME